jgi:hypothetical protein
MKNYNIGSVRVFAYQLKGIRLATIDCLKEIAKKFGDENGYLELNSVIEEVSFLHPNTEDVIYGFDSEGKVESENGEEGDVLEDISTDVLMMMWEKLSENLKFN